MLLASSGMFLLGTTGMLFTVPSTAIYVALLKAMIQDDTVTTQRLYGVYTRLFAASEIRVVTNGLFTDLVFLYRCYVVWGSRKTVLILPGIFMLAAYSLGYFVAASDNFGDTAIAELRYFIAAGTSAEELPVLSAVILRLSDMRVAFAIDAVANVILCCLTAGRIWYKSRETRYVTGNVLHRRCHTAVAMILESGALYCSCKPWPHCLLPSRTAHSFFWACYEYFSIVYNILAYRDPATSTFP
ncbi:hypothetical protein C8R45DRAFT_1001041 [Mycena sanguinolenta]|nr:hypothetical protein C8R45DRAFT_1001041 [Mycena sanguinolenta]